MKFSQFLHIMRNILKDNHISAIIKLNVSVLIFVYGFVNTKCVALPGAEHGETDKKSKQSFV